MTKIPCKVLTTFVQQFWGLMFSRSVELPLLFVLPEPRRFAIHSLFCPAFDAVFLDADQRVIDVFQVRTVQLWIQPHREALYLIEAPPGFAAKATRGQRIRIDWAASCIELGP